VAILFALQLSVLAFPQPFFSHSQEIGYCQVYSDVEITPQLVEVINDVNGRLDAIELHDKNKTNRVFICHSQGLYSFFARLTLVTPMAQGYNLSTFGNSFVSMTRIDQLRTSSGGFPPYAITEGNPAHTIVHEIVHQYMVDTLGFFGNYRLPPMKREGYAEYGSSIRHIRDDVVYPLPRRIDILLNDDYWFSGYDRVREHYRAGLIVEYLSELKGYSFADIMDDSLRLDSAYEEMIQWYNQSGS
jgi:hypothetical protein